MRTVFLLVSLMGVALVQAAPFQVQGIRLWAAPDQTRVVLDLDRPAEHEIFVLDDPPRLVVDLANARLQTNLSQPRPEDPLVKRLRSGTRNGGDLRVVLDLKAPIHEEHFMLKPNRAYSHRLVIDLEQSAPPPNPRQVEAQPQPLREVPKARPVQADPIPDVPLREAVVAIDAGHGGEDPGAQGYRGTYEKDIVLQIAKRLEKLIEKEPGMRAVMTRDGDYYVALRRRIELARKHQADLFLSIHADAFHDHSVQGSSVYALSIRGATTEAARWLAKRENEADLIGGVSLDDKDDLLASVLLDLSQTATIESSLELGERIIQSLGGVGKLHKHRVQQAGFVVLKSPDIPSVLIETAFISNPDEERKLRSARNQQEIAQAILAGVQAYFRSRAPRGTWLAQRQHVIQAGDTLSAIAARYNVPVERLRGANGLKSDLIRIGQVLRIPSDG